LFVVLGLIFFFNVFTPFFILFLFVKTGIAKSFLLEKQTERILPLFIYAIMLYLSAVICKRWELSPLWDITLLLLAMTSLFTLLVTLFYKISFHMVGWGALLGLSCFLTIYYNVDMYLLISVVIILSGAVAWARAILKSHDFFQLVLGYLLGFVIFIIPLFIIFS
jgi:hypothetical protein